MSPVMRLCLTASWTFIIVVISRTARSIKIEWQWEYAVKCMYTFYRQNTNTNKLKNVMLLTAVYSIPALQTVIYSEIEHKE